MREGRDLERLVAALEKIAANDPTVKIESPYFAPDRVTGAQREHDVGIKITKGHHELVIALECRDRSRNVTVPEVEAFAQKCADTGVHKGAIVSSKGFASDALLKAAHLGVGCLTVEQARELSWFKIDSFASYSSRVIGNHWLLIPESDLPLKPSKFHIEDSNGGTVVPESLDGAVLAEINKHDAMLFGPPGVRRFHIQFLMPGYFLCDEEAGTRVPLKHANVTVDVEIKVTTATVEKWVYRDESKGKNLIEAGVVPIDLNGVTGNLFFVSGASGINVAFRIGDPL